MNENSLFATPSMVESIDECNYYHTMDIPGHGTRTGLWDLRGRTEEYIGHYSLPGKRVLEIGPASGFLTFEMEQRGATVVAIEVPEDPGWDFVPYPASVLEPMYAGRREVMLRLRNSFWFAHHAFDSKSKVWYGDTYNLPEELGKFDVAVMAGVLLHVHSPLLVMAQCAKRASTLVVTELYFEDLEGMAVSRLHPTVENRNWDTWWHFSSDFFRQFASVLGYSKLETTRHSHIIRNGGEVPFFTLVASR